MDQLPLEPLVALHAIVVIPLSYSAQSDGFGEHREQAMSGNHGTQQ